MPTNLLLEGSDLESLLARAHAEGGASARIVRAEKVRRGGFLGFFAKEGFEVAVEVPEGSSLLDIDALRRLPAQPAAHAAATATTGSPRAAAATGLDHLADRVDVAEQAAARALVMDAARRALEASDTIPMLPEPAGAGSKQPSANPAMGPSMSPSPPSTAGPAFAALLDQLRTEVPNAPVPLHTADPLAGDRLALRALGVPESWTMRMRGGDRFDDLLRVLDQLPAADLDTDAATVAVVGPGASLEAHRTALDLAVGETPRPVVAVPIAASGRRSTVLPAALAAVAAIDCGDAPAEADATRTALRMLNPGIVVAMVEASWPTSRMRSWLDAIGGADALAVSGATDTSDPARVLALGVPVIRLDGIPIDRVTWAALLCARMAS